MASPSSTERAPVSAQAQLRSAARLPVRVAPSHRAEVLVSEAAVAAVFLLFVGATFLLGGGSRSDIASLTLLRPLAVLAVLYAALALLPGQVAAVRPLLAGLGGIAALITLQLIPLPPDIWARLPGRELYGEVARASRTADVWRPSSLVPSATANALSSLLVPLAGLLLAGALGTRLRQWWPRAILYIGIASAMLGLIQIAGPPGSALYFYRITNATEAVGLFANRNHHAVLLAALIPLAAWCCRAGFLGRNGAPEPLIVRQAVFVFATVALLLAVLATGSRAGLLCAALMLGWASMMLRGSREPYGDTRRSASHRWFWAAPLMIGAAGAVAAALASRGTGIDRLAGADSLSEIRLQVLPTLWDMVLSFMPVGSGYGSFAQVYRAFEPDGLLRPEYLNQAHNDWLQMVIEGGLPALAAALLATGWLTSRLAKALRARLAAEARLELLAGAGVWLCFAVASLVDYPGRVPSIMLFLALAATPFCRPLPSRKPGVPAAPAS